MAEAEPGCGTRLSTEDMLAIAIPSQWRMAIGGHTGTPASRRRYRRTAATAGVLYGAMARKTIERMIDDIDGSEAQANVRFEIDGQNWSIDLNAKHENEIRTKLGPFLDAARRVRSEPSRHSGPVRVVADKARNTAIRQWALDAGVQLPSRGRIAGAVQDAFDAQDVPALYAAAGLEMEQPVKRGRRRSPNAEFSAAE